MKSLATALLCVGLAAPGYARGTEIDCVIQPKVTVTVSFPIEGLVEEVLVDRGDRVEKGQPVARLESDLQRATLEISKARAEAKGGLEIGAVRLEYAERALERQSTLQQRDVVSEHEMDEAHQDHKAAEALLLDAREKRQIAALEEQRAVADLERRTIRSPVAGVVVERMIAAGEYADPPQVLKVAQIDPLHVEVFAPLSLYGKVEVGSQGRVRPEEPLGGEYAATVTVVDPVVDAASGTFGIRLELPNPNYEIPAGLNCRVRFGNGVGPVAVEGSPTDKLE